MQTTMDNRIVLCQEVVYDIQHNKITNITHDDGPYIHTSNKQHSNT